MTTTQRLHVGTRKGLFTLGRAGADWEIAQRSFVGIPVTAVLEDPRDGAIYAGVKHGHFGPKLHVSRDGGKSWADAGTPKFPPAPEAEVQKDSMGRPWPWSLDTIWTLEAGGADRPGELWCGTIPGGLFHSVDGGATWELVRSLWDLPARKKWFGGGFDLPGIHSVLVHPTKPDEVLLGVSCGGVWLTEDRGRSWRNTAKGMRAGYMPPEQAGDPEIQDPHRLARSKADPSKLFAQHHSGIFQSGDGGRSWTEVKKAGPSTFGFAVAMHPSKPGTVWFAPAVSDETRVPVDGKVVVTRSEDGGKSFSVQREGLPQKDAYDLVYRHGLDVSADGASLAMGSTTGNLWLSSDEGRAWSLFSAHLPPVFCVRFGC